MRDMLDAKEGYPLTAWRVQFGRIRTDLEDAVAREAEVAHRRSIPLCSCFITQFWTALDRMFDLASRDETEARA